MHIRRTFLKVLALISIVAMCSSALAGAAERPNILWITCEDTTAWLLQKTTPAEELYDLAADPHQLNNLASSPGHKDALARLRETLYGRMREIRDTGLLSETEMHGRFTGSPYDGMHNLSEARYDAILDTPLRTR